MPIAAVVVVVVVVGIKVSHYGVTGTTSMTLQSLPLGHWHSARDVPLAEPTASRTLRVGGTGILPSPASEAIRSSSSDRWLEQHS